VSLLDDLDRLKSDRRNAGGTECGVARLLRRLPPDEAAALIEMIDGTDVYASRISELLKQHGHELGSGKIQHHRRRVRGAGCKCPLAEASE
jgi:hypothetical protein